MTNHTCHPRMLQGKTYNNTQDFIEEKNVQEVATNL
jgi:hypothetical protein